MSAEESSPAVTHECAAGTKPEALQLRLPVIWTNSGPEDSIVRNNGISVISTPNIRDWDSFKRDLFTTSEHSSNDLVAYIDSEDDLIPIESQCELNEALKIATKRATEKSQTKKRLYLVVDRGFDPNSSEEKMENFHVHCTESSAMPPINTNDGGENITRINQQNEMNFNVKKPESSDDAAPKWFTNYMQAMKEEIVAEVSEKVTKRVTEALKINRKNHTDPVYFNPRFLIDSEYNLDSDSDDARKKLSSCDKSAETRTNESSTRTMTHNSDNNSRRRHRNPDKQRKKSKNNVSQGTNNFEKTLRRYRDSTSSPKNRRRSEKFVDKCDDDDSRGTTSRSIEKNHENLKNPNDIDLSEIDTPYRRMIASGIRQMSFTPVNSNDITEAPIMKFRLADSHVDAESNLSEISINEKSRMGCSVTGKNIIEQTNDRVPEYSGLSDSDNISIISDISRTSDVRIMSNSFEMIDEESSRKLDVTEEHRYYATTEYKENNDDYHDVNDDADGNRDSSSFELLSESASPSVSIHIDEDHFSPSQRETKSYNFNDDANMEKGENRYKTISRTLVIDVEGRIYSIDMMKSNDDYIHESIHEKRTDGNYSFVADNLPGSARENSNTSTEETIIVNDDFANDKDGDTVKNCHDETNHDDKSIEGNSNETFHESTQSFHSHTASKTDNECPNFHGHTSTNATNEKAKSSESHIFVDHNASKGLGDTKKSSPSKQNFKAENHDEFTSERQKSSRKQSNASNHDSSTRENENLRDGDGTRIFGDWSTTRATIIDDIVFNSVDPMHILPETIVTNAVHVATRAYTTARRVYEKIITNQTRKRAEKSKFGRRYAFGDF